MTAGERPRQDWKCPEGCTWPECIHVCRERIRLVGAVISAALETVEVARMVLAPPCRPTMTLVGALSKFDAAVKAQREGP